MSIPQINERDKEFSGLDIMKVLCQSFIEEAGNNKLVDLLSTGCSSTVIL